MADDVRRQHLALHIGGIGIQGKRLGELLGRALAARRLLDHRHGLGHRQPRTRIIAPARTRPAAAPTSNTTAPTVVTAPVRCRIPRSITPFVPVSFFFRASGATPSNRQSPTDRHPQPARSSSDTAVYRRHRLRSLDSVTAYVRSRSLLRSAAPAAAESQTPAAEDGRANRSDTRCPPSRRIAACGTACCRRHPWQ